MCFSMLVLISFFTSCFLLSFELETNEFAMSFLANNA